MNKIQIQYENRILINFLKKVRSLDILSIDSILTVNSIDKWALWR